MLTALLLVCAGPAPAFHDGGVGHCNGCHTIHNSQDGTPVNPGAPNEWLLIRETATDVCLTCHASANGAVFASDPLNPPPEKGAGNFGFLLEDNLNDGPDGALFPIPGSEAGHNVVSPAWGIPVDPEHPVAPGGSFPSAELGCTSCHDPHGNTSYRMLRGVGPVGDGIHFTAPAPRGDGIALDSAEGPTNHTAYQNGWAQWCRNCHGLNPHAGSPAFDHPLWRAVGGVVGENYNEYDGPADPAGGNIDTAYLPQVPFEDPGMTISSTSGVFGNSQITCMTCHRAHATSAPHALRWDPNVVRLDEDGLVSGSYAIPNPYTDPEQRALCVKCHYPEASQHGMDQPCLSCHGGLTVVLQGRLTR